MGSEVANGNGRAVPPHSLEAEQSVLGAVLLSDRALRALVDEEGLRPDHFYRERHRLVFAAMCEMFDGAERPDELAIDVLTVTEHLRSKGQLEDVGGKVAIDGLTGGVPGLGGIRGYAQIVKLHWEKRRTLAAAYEIQAGVLNHDDEQVGNGRRLLDELVIAPPGQAYHTSPRAFAEHLERFITAKRPKGFPLPWPTIANVLSLRRGNGTVISGWTSVGKALDVTTPIPTPSGWTTMGDLQVGDQLFDETGAPCRVTVAYGVLLDRSCFAVRFNDGAEIVADEGHLWTTWTDADRRPEAAAQGLAVASRIAINVRRERWAWPQIRTTGEIRDSLRTSAPDGPLNHSIPLAGALRYPTADLPIDPYVLGAWLGDSSSDSTTLTCSLTDAAHFVRELDLAGEGPRLGIGPRGVARINFAPSLALVVETGLKSRLGPVCTPANRKAHRTRVSGLTVAPRTHPPTSTRLRDLGVLTAKHIPELYLLASVQQRLALLQGLMDTAGTVAKDGRCEFLVTSWRLAEGFFDLTLSMGLRASWAERDVKPQGRTRERVYHISFATTLPVFRLARKATRQCTDVGDACHTHRYVESVEPVPTRPVRCIEVDSPSRLFLAGRHCVATHNSQATFQTLAHVHRMTGAHCAAFITEMTEEEHGCRQLSRDSAVPYEALMDGDIEANPNINHQRLLRALAEFPYTVYGVHGESVDTISRLIRQVRPDVAVLDHFHALPDVGRAEDATNAVAKLLAAANKADCHLIIVAQLNRARDDASKKPPPTLRDLKATAALEHLPSNIILVHRDSVVVPGSEDDDVPKYEFGQRGYIQVAKQRGGRTVIAPVDFIGERHQFLEPDPRYSTPASKDDEPF